MLAKLKRLFAPEAEAVDTEALLHKAAALLMLEIAQADDEFDETERAAIKQHLEQVFGLSALHCDELLAAAEQESAELLSIQGLTRLLVDELSEVERYNLMQQLWRVAYADGRLDHYEEHMLRRISDLLYLPHSAFIQAKLQAAES